MAAAFVVLSLLSALSPATLAFTLEAAPSDEERFPAEDGWIAIKEPADWAKMTAGGKYYLAQNITFGTQKYTPSSENSVGLTIDGNYHTVTISQNQAALFDNVDSLTMRNITLEGDLYFGDGGGMNSPIARWSNKGATILTDVTSRVNYKAINATSKYQNVSGLAVSAEEGSMFRNVIYSGEILVELGARYISVAGIVGTSKGATFENCVNNSKIVVKGPISIGAPGRSYFAVGGIAAVTSENSTFSRCSNMGQIIYSALPRTDEANVILGQAFIGGIVGYASGGVTMDKCQNVGDITVDDFYAESGGGSVGGVLGYSEVASKLTECSNKGDIICREDKFNLGGIVGSSCGIELESCINDGSIESVSEQTVIGGILAYSDNGTTGAELCANNGRLILGEKAGSSVAGGILGQTYALKNTKASLWIEKCSNKGSISTQATNPSVFMGGIVGKTEGTPYLYLYHSQNAGEISNGVAYGEWAATGGIVGALTSVGTAKDGYTEAVYEITNCINSGNLMGCDRVGGIVGANYQFLLGEMRYTIARCSNRGVISAVKSGGGILGVFNERGYASDGSHSDTGITLSECDNSGMINGDGISGGIVGRVYQLKTTPSIFLSSCTNAAKVGFKNEMFASKQSGGLVGYSPVPVLINNSVSSGELLGEQRHPFVLGAFSGEENIFVLQAGVDNIEGASATDVAGALLARGQREVLAYDRSALEALCAECEKMSLSGYLALTQAKFKEESIKARELLRMGDTELTQKAVNDSYAALLAAKEGLTVRAENSTTQASTAAASGGCGSSLSAAGAVIIITVAAFGVALRPRKED